MNCIEDYSIDQKILNRVAREYSTLDYSQKLKELLTTLYPTSSFSDYGKYHLHKQLNDVILRYYSGEEVIKYALFNLFYKKNLVAAFEIRVKNSRADFVTINGYSSSFEIKSNLDNLYKLRKQSLDYQLAFDYNYIVIDDKHLENAVTIIPPCFGIWSFTTNGKKIVHREAILNTKIDPEFQLCLLTKKERLQKFKPQKGLVSSILKEHSQVEINKSFKMALKWRYQKRWEFLISNYQTILPIDLQFFFNYNIEPDIIYHH